VLPSIRVARSSTLTTRSSIAHNTPSRYDLLPQRPAPRCCLRTVSSRQAAAPLSLGSHSESRAYRHKGAHAKRAIDD
jgi:hypothetical protein